MKRMIRRRNVFLIILTAILGIAAGIIWYAQDNAGTRFGSRLYESIHPGMTEKQVKDHLGKDSGVAWTRPPGHPDAYLTDGFAKQVYARAGNMDPVSR